MKRETCFTLGFVLAILITLLVLFLPAPAPARGGSGTGAGASLLAQDGTSTDVNVTDDRKAVCVLGDPGVSVAAIASTAGREYRKNFAIPNSGELRLFWRRDCTVTIHAEGLSFGPYDMLANPQAKEETTDIVYELSIGAVKEEVWINGKRYRNVCQSTDGQWSSWNIGRRWDRFEAFLGVPDAWNSRYVFYFYAQGNGNDIISKEVRYGDNPVKMSIPVRQYVRLSIKTSNDGVLLRPRLVREGVVVAEGPGP